MNQPGEARRINMKCSCGKQLSASLQHAGKRLRCTSCGQACAVPVISSPSPLGAPPQVANELESMSRNTLFALWSFVGVFALACVLFLVWNSHSSHQAKVAAANGLISDAVVSANEWISGNSLLTGEAVEQRLSDVMKNVDATERTDGEATLAKTRQRRKQLVEQAEATAIYVAGKKRLDTNDVQNAIELLSKYVADPNATEKADAQRLLTDARIAVSDSQSLDVLVAMTDEEFDRVQATGEIKDGKFTHPALMAAHTETIQRNLNRAAERRMKIKLADEKRREKERLATEHTEWLRTRTPDVRNVCWGDSLPTVRQVESMSLKQEGDSQGLRI